MGIELLLSRFCWEIGAGGNGVVARCYGIGRKKREVYYCKEKVKADDLEEGECRRRLGYPDQFLFISDLN